MYEAFFGFTARPFPAIPSAERYYPASSIEAARCALARCVERAEGLGIVMGGAGSGKTLLCEVIARQFQSPFLTVRLACGRLSGRKALLQALLYELRVPYRKLDESELRLTLIEQASRLASGRRGVLLIVDEAHTLHWRLFDELRMLTNLVRDGNPQFSLMMAGDLSLEERLTNPRLEAFSQRIAARCYLGRLQRDETASYIRAQLAASGLHSGSIFAETAVDAIYRVSEGAPRVINQVCDHALLLASLGGQRRLDAAAIEEAWSELQQLPSSTTAPSSQRDNGKTVVEFGALDELSDDQRAAIPFPLAADNPGRSAEQKMAEIGEHLADLDEEFSPAGSIGPEVELVFDGWLPQQESFAEEEVLLDRFARIEDRGFAAQPAVASHEGRELAALLDAAPQYRTMSDSAPKTVLSPISPRPRVLAAADSAPAAMGFDWPQSEVRSQLGEATILVSPGIPRAAAIDLALPTQGDLPFDQVIDRTSVVASTYGVAPAAPTAVPRFSPASPQVDTVWPAEPAMGNEPTPAGLRSRGAAASGATVIPVPAGGARQPTDLDIVQPEEAEIVIVDDDSPPTVSVSSRQAPLVRRQEYRQLFAKLRRG